MNRPVSWLSDLENISVMRRYQQWLMEMAGPHLGGRVLEAGCGIGSNMLLLAGRELVLGVDRDPEAVERARKRIAGMEGIEARVMDLLDPGFASLAGPGFSGVLLVNVLSLVRDRQLAVSQASRVLRPGGNLVIIDAAVPAVAGRLDREWGIERFDRSGLRDLLVSGGLEVKILRYFNLLGLFGWVWDNVTRGTCSFSRKEYASRDRFVPLARLLDKVTGPPLGRTLFAVAAKK